MAVLFRTRILTSVGAALGSATCWDRERVMLGGLGPDPRFPSTCSLLPVSPPHSGPWILHEGRGYVSSIRLYLEWCGKAQDHRVALQAGGILYAFIRQ